MDAAMVVVIHELADGGLERAGQVVVLQQDPVLQRLMPAFDLALRLRVVRRPSNVISKLVMRESDEGR